MWKIRYETPSDKILKLSASLKNISEVLASLAPVAKSSVVERLHSASVNKLMSDLINTSSDISDEIERLSSLDS